MPFNGAGVFTPPGADFPAVALTLIQASKFNNVINDIATGLSNSVTRDGQSPATANLPMGGFRHTGVSDGVARNQYASLGQSQDSAALWGGTAGGTADALTLTLSPAITAYVAGQKFTFKSGASPNTGAATVAINGLAAKTIQKNVSALVAGDIIASRYYELLYDGTNFQLLFQPALNFLPITGGTLLGDLLFTDNTYDIGKTGATRPRDIFASRNITLDGLLDASAATAGQIKFPAAQNASANVNTLDDYEEGSWTPSVGGTATYSSATGSYTKIGNLVFFTGSMAITLIGSGLTSTINGLPFTSGTGTFAVAIANSATLATAVVSVTGQVASASTSVTFRSRTAANASDGVNALFQNAASISFSGCYSI